MQDLLTALEITASEEEVFMAAGDFFVEDPSGWGILELQHMCAMTSVHGQVECTTEEVKIGDSHQYHTRRMAPTHFRQIKRLILRTVSSDL
jgi:hypothetical protein